MKTLICLFLALLFSFSIHNNIEAQKPLKRLLNDKTSTAKVDPVVDNYFGTSVTDPYRYMEDLKNPKVYAWFKSHADYSRQLIDAIPGRQKLLDKMYEFDERAGTRRFNLSITDNDQYFYQRLTPDDDTGKLYYRDGYNGEEYLLLDPHTYEEGKKYTISTISPSQDGSHVVAGIAEGGSEVNTLVIIRVEDRTIYPERIERCMSASNYWLQDGNAFTYLQENSDDVNAMNKRMDAKALLHKLGSDPAEDRVLLSREKYPELKLTSRDIPFVVYDNDNGLVYGYAYTVERNLKVFFAPGSTIYDESIPWSSLIQPEHQIQNMIATPEAFYFLTTQDAPNYKIIKTSLDNPKVKNAKVVVEEDADAPIKSFTLTSDGMYYTLSFNGIQEKLYFLPEGSSNARELTLPFTAGNVSLQAKGPRFSDIWVIISGWTSKPQRYRYVPDKDEFILENLSTPVEFPEFVDLVAEELMVSSHDGTMVPLSIIYNKGVERNSSNPVFLYGYGAYGMSMNPVFSPSMYLWTTEGGIVAIAHVRGGGELGNAWHQAGYKTTKPNSWKDLIACTEYLIKHNYTSPDHVAIHSASAGGIMVGRAMTERPDLFKVVLPHVGVMNPMRAEFSPNGPANIPEFGTVKDSIECKALMEMDAYLHLKEGEKYPATLVTAGINDPRVSAWSPGKFAARLMAVNASENPIIFLPDFDSGHGIGDVKSKQIEGFADMMSFALWQVGHQEYQIRENNQ